jgi:pilus assembly protein CpaB
VVGKTATLELTPRQAEMLALARQLGTLQLALRSLADSDPSKRPEAATDEGKGRPTSDRVNMIRFGVSTSTLPR